MLLIAPPLAWVFATGAASADVMVYGEYGGKALGEGSCSDVAAEGQQFCNLCKYLVLLMCRSWRLRAFAVLVFWGAILIIPQGHPTKIIF